MNKLLTSVRDAKPWCWIPTLYFAEGLPNVIVVSVALVMYHSLGLSDAEIALYTSWLYLPWVIKPFWAPFVEMFRTNRWWILVMQLLIGASLAGVAFTLNTPAFVQWTLAFFWLMAFSSATHDIAADGFYMKGLDEHHQAYFVGIRSTFYRIAMLFGQGGLVAIAGLLREYCNTPPVEAWGITFIFTAALFIGLGVYHTCFLPRPVEDCIKEEKEKSPFAELLRMLITFFRHPQIIPALIFIFLYRFPEAILVKIAPLFLLAPVEKGGMGINELEFSAVYATSGTIGLTLGGIAGGIVIARYGFNKTLWSMVLAISLPHVFYILLAWLQPDYLGLIGLCVFIEQAGYGFGFTAYMVYLMYISKGEYKTAHYAFCTGLMALGLMLPGMFAGYLSEHVGYLNSFIIIMALCILTVLAAAVIRVDADYGKKEA